MTLTSLVNPLSNPHHDKYLAVLSRIGTGETQRAIAKEFGVHECTISKWADRARIILAKREELCLSKDDEAILTQKCIESEANKLKKVHKKAKNYVKKKLKREQESINFDHFADFFTKNYEKISNEDRKKIFEKLSLEFIEKDQEFLISQFQAEIDCSLAPPDVKILLQLALSKFKDKFNPDWLKSVAGILKDVKDSKFHRSGFLPSGNYLFTYEVVPDLLKIFKSHNLDFKNLVDYALYSWKQSKGLIGDT